MAAGAGRVMVRLRAESSDVASAESGAEREITVLVVVNTVEMIVGV